MKPYKVTFDISEQARDTAYQVAREAFPQGSDFTVEAGDEGRVNVSFEIDSDDDHNQAHKLVAERTLEQYEKRGIDTKDIFISVADHTDTGAIYLVHYR